MKLLATLTALVIMTGVAFAADDAVVAMTWMDFAKGLWAEVLAYLSGPAVLAFLMAQARALFPFLGNLGIFTLLGDIIVGNYGAAKNKA